MESTGYPPWSAEEKVPFCPVCDSECDEFFYNKDGDVVGCENCIEARDAWEIVNE